MSGGGLGSNNDDAGAGHPAEDKEAASQQVSPIADAAVIFLRLPAFGVIDNDDDESSLHVVVEGCCC